MNFQICYDKIALKIFSRSIGKTNTGRELTNEEPVLVIMAPGHGQPLGGLKQIDPIDSDGHIIIDFSIYDAVRAGFEKVIFIIKRENEQIFP